jgi:mitogen-activated protein kinase 1/3
MLDYSFPVDMWSVGCVLGELLMTNPGNSKSFLDREPLFPGESCYPISPDFSNLNLVGQYPCHESEQLHTIFSLIGTPTESDLLQISDPEVVEYLRHF